jgi:hypothetical protein
MEKNDSSSLLVGGVPNISGGGLVPRFASLPTSRRGTPAANMILRSSLNLRWLMK